MSSESTDPRTRLKFGKVAKTLTYFALPASFVAFLIVTLSQKKAAAAIFAAGVIGLLLVELLRRWLGKAQTKTTTYTDASTSFSIAAITGLVNNIFLIPVFYILMTFFYEITPLRLEPVLKRELGTAGMIITFLLLVVLVDFMYYWAHRGAHSIEVLWGSHSVHHSSEHFNPSTATRIAFLDEAWDIVLLSSLVLLGVNPMYVFAAYALVLLYQLPVHNTWVRTLPRPIEFGFNTPEHHRAHHAYQRIYLDKNFGGIFMIWDRSFGTSADIDNSMEPEFGLTTPVGTSNPVKAMFHEFHKIGHNVRTAGSFKSALQYIFGAPDWKPTN